MLFDIDLGEGVAVHYGSAIVIDQTPDNPVLNASNSPNFDLASFIGDYNRLGFGTMSIFMENGHLYARFPFTTFRLIHEEGDIFASTFTEEVPTIMTSPFLRFNFVITDGRISGVSMNMDVGGLLFEKVK